MSTVSRKKNPTQQKSRHMVIEFIKNLSTYQFASDVFLGVILSSLTFMTEYFCSQWFESVDVSKHYMTSIRVSLQLVAVTLSLVCRRVFELIFIRITSKKERRIEVKFLTEMFGLFIGSGIIILILFLTGK